MIIGVDRGQKSGKHEVKHKMLTESGNTLISMPILVGDYIEITPEIMEVIQRRGSKLSKADTAGLIKVSVDTKRNCEELYSDLISDHKRFSDECFLAKNSQIKLFVLVENTDGVTSVNNLERWKNEKRWFAYFKAKKKADREFKKPPKSPATPSQLKKQMWTMKQRYGVEFVFCTPQESAAVIYNLLIGGDADG